jgi:hypothetical protein
MMPLSAAAGLVLSVSVLLRMQQEGSTPIPAEESATQPPAATFQAPADPAPAATEPAAGAAATPPAAEMRSHERREAVAEPFPAPVPERAQEKAQPHSADEMPGALDRDEAETLMSPPAGAGDAAGMQRDTQLGVEQEWIERIRLLRRGGRDTEAETELENFRQRYPDYPLPEDLLPPQH